MTNQERKKEEQIEENEVEYFWLTFTKKRERIYTTKTKEKGERI
jgi:hypothetical protein